MKTSTFALVSAAVIATSGPALPRRGPPRWWTSEAVLASCASLGFAAGIVLALIYLQGCANRTAAQAKSAPCGLNAAALTSATCTVHDGTEVVMTHDLTWDRQ